MYRHSEHSNSVTSNFSTISPWINDYMTIPVNVFKYQLNYTSNPKMENNKDNESPGII